MQTPFAPTVGFLTRGLVLASALLLPLSGVAFAQATGQPQSAQSNTSAEAAASTVKTDAAGNAAADAAAAVELTATELAQKSLSTAGTAASDAASTGKGAAKARNAMERAQIPLSGDYGSKVDQRWQAFLEDRGLREGVNPGNVFVASGTAIVSFESGRPGWIEARRVAFQLADLRARAEMVGMIAQTVQRTANVRLLENMHFGQGYVDQTKDLSQAARILHKTADLTEATLDNALKQLDADYDPQKYKDMGHTEKEKRLEALFQEKIMVEASRAMTGVMTLHVIGGPTASGQQQKILVGVIWTPELSRLASLIGDAAQGMPLSQAVAQIEDKLPQTRGEAVASFGTRFIIDDKGRIAVLAFGQAEPANVGPTQMDRATQFAMERAERYAEAAIASFVGQRVTFGQSVESKALTRVYAGLAQQGSTIDIKSVQKINAATRPVTLVGVQTIRRWVIPHPATDQKIAIAVKLWSPAAQAAAKQMGRVMRSTRLSQDADVIEQQEVKVKPATKKSDEPLVLERAESDKRAYQRLDDIL